uniref:Uncharacterized protein n=1 Tax=Rhizophora mucronata TaxID=61149 RepID=A0A2P2N9D5_RHIMU
MVEKAKLYISLSFSGAPYSHGYLPSDSIYPFPQSDGQRSFTQHKHLRIWCFLKISHLYHIITDDFI